MKKDSIIHEIPFPDLKPKKGRWIRLIRFDLRVIFLVTKVYCQIRSGIRPVPDRGVF